MMQDRRSFLRRVSAAVLGVAAAAYCPSLGHRTAADAIREEFAVFRRRISDEMADTLTKSHAIFVSKNGLYEMRSGNELVQISGSPPMAGETRVVEIWDEWGSTETGD